MLSMNEVRSFLPAHTRSPMWVILKIVIYSLLWLVEYQFKGVVKFNLSDLFFWGQFRRSWKRLNWKNLLLTLSAVTRIINMVYLRRFLIFTWTLHKVDVSIKQTLLSCPNGVHFIEIPLQLLKRRWVQPKILLLFINLFSLNFISIEIEGQRVSPSQNKSTLGERRVAPKWIRVNKGKGGGQNSGIFNECTFWMSPNLIKNKLCCMLMPQNLVKTIDYVHLLPKTKFSIYFLKYAPNKENSSSTLNFCFLIFFFCNSFLW